MIRFPSLIGKFKSNYGIHFRMKQFAKKKKDLTRGSVIVILSLGITHPIPNTDSHTVIFKICTLMLQARNYKGKRNLSIKTDTSLHP
jgi:hypothetical protein